MKPLASTAICVPFDSQAHYRRIVNDLDAFRAHLLQVHDAHPELFPHDFASFHFHSKRLLRSLDLMLRRVRLPTTRKVFLIRPSFVMPQAVGLVEDFADPLILRRWSVPFEELGRLFGRDPKVYERALRGLGRFPLLGSVCPDGSRIPGHLVADEKFTRLEGSRSYLAVTAAQGVLLGTELLDSVQADALEQAYGVFQREAQGLEPDYQPESVCLDGFASTHQAWESLWPNLPVILCFLHSVLSLYRAAGRHLRQEVCRRAWEVYRAPNKASFSQRLRRMREWAEKALGEGRFPDKVRARLAKMREKREEFTRSYEVEGSSRTSNAVDRLMVIQGRHLSAQRNLRGKVETGQATVRAHAMMWNFHTFTARTRRQPGHQHRHSPFQDLNGFRYADNWLENLLIAAYAAARRAA